jgi:phage shock protein E
MFNCTNINKFDCVIDVRTPIEFAQGSVKGAINVPLNQLHEHIPNLSKDESIGVFCRSGARSYYAEMALRQHGFDATNIGGIIQYAGCIQ